METNDLQRLASMGAALRPDWPARSLLTFLTKHFEGRAYGDIAVALAWVATRTKTDTPRLLLEAGPWWKACATETGTAPRPPKREEACATCGLRQTQHLGNPVLADHEFTPLDQATRGRTTAAEMARAELARAREHLCCHGIDRRAVKCGDCERPTPADPAACELPGRETSETTETGSAA